jgi:hypothetical protein
MHDSVRVLVANAIAKYSLRVNFRNMQSLFDRSNERMPHLVDSAHTVRYWCCLGWSYTRLMRGCEGAPKLRDGARAAGCIFYKRAKRDARLPSHILLTTCGPIPRPILQPQLHPTQPIRSRPCSRHRCRQTPPTAFSRRTS